MNKCILGTIRVTLIVACVLIFLLSLIILGVLLTVDSQSSDVVHPAGAGVTWSFYLLQSLLLGVSIVGLYGACAKNSTCLKLFALLITIYSIILFLKTAHDYGNDWPELSKQFANTMADTAKSYQWEARPGTKLNEATRGWDLVQSGLLCCGLKGPSDWTKGPLHKGGGDGDLPLSCCRNLFQETTDGKCTILSGKVFKIGCLDKFEQIRSFTIIRVLFLTLTFILFALLALILANKSNKKPVHLVYS